MFGRLTCSKAVLFNKKLYDKCITPGNLQVFSSSFDVKSAKAKFFSWNIHPDTPTWQSKTPSLLILTNRISSEPSFFFLPVVICGFEMCKNASLPAHNALSGIASSSWFWIFKGTKHLQNKTIGRTHIHTLAFTGTRMQTSFCLLVLLCKLILFLNNSAVMSFTSQRTFEQPTQKGIDLASSCVGGEGKNIPGFYNHMSQEWKSADCLPAPPFGMRRCMIHHRVTGRFFPPQKNLGCILAHISLPYLE